MDKFALIGYPIKDSLSPLLFKAAYHGKYDYDLIEYPEFDICFSIFKEKGYRAINVTAPFKTQAIKVADILSEECLECGAANILLKTESGIKAFNSDFLALKKLLTGSKSVIVIGGGGAGKAALAAARSIGITPLLLHHDELQGRNIEADTIVCTLPHYAPGIENIHCNTLIEANYKTPSCNSLKNVKNYIPGTTWLKEQAILGYELMCGEQPDTDAIRKSI